MYGVMSVYKSPDKGESFTRKYIVGPVFSTLMDHTIHKHGKNYYILIPGFGILLTTDFEKFDVYWYNEDLNDMFMDDEGVIIARELGGQQVHYRDTRQ
jgi:hypothetical protein